MELVAFAAATDLPTLLPAADGRDPRADTPGDLHFAIADRQEYVSTLPGDAGGLEDALSMAGQRVDIAAIGAQLDLGSPDAPGVLGLRIAPTHAGIELSVGHVMGWDYEAAVGRDCAGLL